MIIYTLFTAEGALTLDIGNVLCYNKNVKQRELNEIGRCELERNSAFAWRQSRVACVPPRLARFLFKIDAKRRNFTYATKILVFDPMCDGGVPLVFLCAGAFLRGQQQGEHVAG
jgi:hypothetical protein